MRGSTMKLFFATSLTLSGCLNWGVVEPELGSDADTSPDADADTDADQDSELDAQDASADADGEADDVPDADLDPCEGVTCSGHGECVVDDGEPECDCDVGYAGDACSECYPGYHIDEDDECVLDETCSEGSCSGHGACDDSTGEVVCDCEPSFTGDHCGECEPEMIGSLVLPGTTRSVAISESGLYAYVTTNGVDGSLRVIDISTPETPVEVGSVATPTCGECRLGEIVTKGSHVLFTNELNGVQVVDVSTPTEPRIVQTVANIDEAYGLALDGNWLYVAVRGVGLQVVRNTDPATAEEVATLTIPDTWSYNVDVESDYAYVVAQSGLVIIDVSDPTRPSEVAALPTMERQWDIAVSGDMAYIGSDWAGSGLRVVDISTLASPSLGAHLDIGDTDYVQVFGDWLFTGGTTMRVFSLEAPESPELVHSIIPGGGVRGVAVADNLAYLATGVTGLAVYDVTCMEI